MKKTVQPNDNSWIREQYGTQYHLKIRMRTHELDFEPKIVFSGCLLDRVTWTGAETVLDVGCRAGTYLDVARQRCRHYISGDLSLGMVQALPAAEPLLAFIDTLRDMFLPLLPPSVTWPMFLEGLGEGLINLLGRNGEIRIRKHAGIFVCNN